MLYSILEPFPTLVIQKCKLVHMLDAKKLSRKVCIKHMCHYFGLPVFFFKKHYWGHFCRGEITGLNSRKTSRLNTKNYL
jgi:hypothetical protein